MFRRLIRLGGFPACWRQVNVTPIPKGLPSSLLVNYPPISLTPVLSKGSDTLHSKRLIPLAVTSAISGWHAQNMVHCNLPGVNSRRPCCCSMHRGRVLVCRAAPWTFIKNIYVVFFWCRFVSKDLWNTVVCIQLPSLLIGKVWVSAMHVACVPYIAKWIGKYAGG